MSRIGKKIIVLTAGVTFTVIDNLVIVKGPLGELRQSILPFVKVENNGTEVSVTVENSKEKLQRAMWGTTSALLQNMVTGVSVGFKQELELNGVGYKMAMAGNVITFALGFSHPVLVTVPSAIKITIERNAIRGESFDKQLIGSFFANIFKLKPHEPYKGKGFKVPGKKYMRKVGKKGGKK
jgi:large subunit ribosomal protein L6